MTPDTGRVNQDVMFEALEQAERRRRWRDLDRATLVVGLVAVPVAAAILAGLVHQDADRLLWPPPPLMALAPLGAYLVLRRVAGSAVELALNVALASFVGLLAMWGVAFVIGMFSALDCLGPEGGCLPGW